MKNLSNFLTEHIKQRLFNDGSNAGRFQDGETFDDVLERILHEGIFKYRKQLTIFSPEEEQMQERINRIKIGAALLAVEANNPHDQRERG